MLLHPPQHSHSVLRPVGVTSPVIPYWNPGTMKGTRLSVKGHHLVNPCGSPVLAEDVGEHVLSADAAAFWVESIPAVQEPGLQTA